MAGSLLGRRLVILGTPLALAVLEMFHPTPDSVVEGVEQGGWFLWFHMIQLLLTGLIALAVYLLTDGLSGRAASVSRWAAGVFAVFFSAYDAAAGIATGFVLLLRCSRVARVCTANSCVVQYRSGCSHPAGRTRAPVGLLAVRGAELAGEVRW